MDKITYCQYQKIIRKISLDNINKKFGLWGIFIPCIASIFAGFIGWIYWGMRGEAMLLALAVLIICFIFFGIIYLCYYFPKGHVSLYNNQLMKIISFEYMKNNIVLPIRIYNNPFWFAPHNKVGIWIDNPSINDHNLTDLYVELNKIWWVLSDGTKIDKSDSIDTANRKFIHSNANNLSDPIPPNRNRLIYIAEIQNNKMALLLKNIFVNEGWKQEIQKENIETHNPSNTQIIDRMIIELVIKANINGKAIKDQIINVWVVFLEKTSHSYFENGYGWKFDENHPPRTQEYWIDLGKIKDENDGQ